MKVVTIGLGYIGLPTAAVLANKGYKVTGVDINNQVIKNLKNGKVHIVEKGLENIFKEVIKNKNLKIQREVPSSDVFIIAVPTPFLKVNNKIIGCEKPFKLVDIDNKTQAIKCGYDE